MAEWPDPPSPDQVIPEIMLHGVKYQDSDVSGRYHSDTKMNSVFKHLPVCLINTHQLFSTTFIVNYVMMVLVHSTSSSLDQHCIHLVPHSSTQQYDRFFNFNFNFSFNSHSDLGCLPMTHSILELFVLCDRYLIMGLGGRPFGIMRTFRRNGAQLARAPHH